MFCGDHSNVWPQPNGWSATGEIQQSILSAIGHRKLQRGFGQESRQQQHREREKKTSNEATTAAHTHTSCAAGVCVCGVLARSFYCFVGNSTATKII